jgi:hypothetical protein
MSAGAKLSIPSGGDMSSEAMSNSILGFGHSYENKDDNKNQSLSYKYEFLCFCVDDRKWFARVQGINYGPYDYKAELLDAICYDLSEEPPAWIPGVLEEIKRFETPDDMFQVVPFPQDYLDTAIEEVIPSEHEQRTANP